MVKKPYVKYLLSVLILGGAMFAELYKTRKTELAWAAHHRDSQP